jgi:hypothetical protein
MGVWGRAGRLGPDPYPAHIKEAGRGGLTLSQGYGRMGLATPTPPKKAGAKTWDGRVGRKAGPGQATDRLYKKKFAGARPAWAGPNNHRQAQNKLAA